MTGLKGDVKRFAQAVRRYRSIENNLHRTPDVIFEEDLSRARMSFEAANFAVVRHFALNLLKLEKTAQDSLAGKRQRAGWDNDYMLKVLQAGATLK